MTEPLFTVDQPDPKREAQACDRCSGTAWASDDALRVRGWLVYDGMSLTDKPLRVRLCPACQRIGARELAATRRPAPRATPLA